MSQYINQLFTCVLREFQQNNLFRFNTLTFRHFLLLLEIDYQKFLSLGVAIKIRSDHVLMANKKTAKLVVENSPNQKKEDATAELNINSSFLGMAVIDAFKGNVQGKDLELISVFKVLAETTQKIRSNDLSSLEEMLFNPIKSLRADICIDG